MSEYEKLKKTLIKRGELFEDNDFPTTQSSIFYHQTSPYTFVWKRPKEFCSNPVFLEDSSMNSSTFFDPNPGKLGDRWFISCIGCISLTKGLFYRVVPADQTFITTYGYCGMFRFRIWWHGKWEEVIVDDKLPTVNNKLMFVQSTRGDIFWASLLEKAYAKLHGSYEALKYGLFDKVTALSDLIGGVAESIILREETTPCSSLLTKFLSMTTVVTAVAHNENANISPVNTSPFFNMQHERLANGILLSTCYSVLDVAKLDKQDAVMLIKLRNPLGSSSDYIGAWGKDSIEWNRLSDEEKQRLQCNEGEFLMSYHDFMKTFTTLEVIHLDPVTSRDEPSLGKKIPWNIRLWRGTWRKGVTAGGCRNHIRSFHCNPQLLLTLNHDDTLIICLNQHSVLDPKVIGFSIYAYNENTNKNSKEDTRLENKFFKRNRSLYNSLYTNCKQISMRCTLDEGKYVLIPTTYEPEQEGNFTIRVCSIKPIELSFLDLYPSLIKQPIVKAPPSFDLKFSQYEDLFLQLADEHKTVNAFELQELLESCLPNDYVKSCATIDVCRQIVATLDASGTLGRLKIDDYKDVMFSLRFWQNIFKKHTKGTPGILRADKLKEALNDIGFLLSVDILSHLILRYMRKDGTLRFGDFVRSILHLRLAFALFEKRDIGNTGTMRMNLAEWVKACLQC